MFGESATFPKHLREFRRAEVRGAAAEGVEGFGGGFRVGVVECFADAFDVSRRFFKEGRDQTTQHVLPGRQAELAGDVDGEGAGADHVVTGDLILRLEVGDEPVHDGAEADLERLTGFDGGDRTEHGEHRAR